MLPIRHLRIAPLAVKNKESHLRKGLDLKLNGTLRLSDETGKRTAGAFSRLINDNAAVFEHYFRAKLFAGSLNIDVPYPPTLQQDLDAGRPAPCIFIRKRELINMPDYIGDGQAWACDLKGSKFPYPIRCWIFRRKGSRVPVGVIEIVSREPLREPYKLKHGDAVTVEVFSQ
jgi:CTP-dependent riboflavin kinase